MYLCNRKTRLARKGFSAASEEARIHGLPALVRRTHDAGRRVGRESPRGASRTLPQSMALWRRGALSRLSHDKKLCVCHCEYATVLPSSFPHGNGLATRS